MSVWWTHGTICSETGSLYKEKNIVNKAKNKTNKKTILNITALLLIAVCATVITVTVIKDNNKTLPAIMTTADAGAQAPDARKSGYYTMLVVGTDKISLSTDVMMLVSVDSVNEKVSILQIPRDTFVNKRVGGYKTVNRVNAIYAAQKNNGSSNALEDCRAIISEHLGVPIDYYVAINTEAFEKIVNAVGGVDFDVPVDMNYEDPEQDLYIHLKAGYQHLDGKAAEGLIRYRGYTHADIDRTDVRADFLRCMAAQIQQRLNLSAVCGIVSQVFVNVKTSASIMDTVKIIETAYAITKNNDNLRIKTISGRVLYDEVNGRWTYYCLNKTLAVADLNIYFNGYVKELTEAEFDKKGFFTDTVNASNSYINNYYNS